MTTQKNDAEQSTDTGLLNPIAATANYAAGSEGDSIAAKEEEDKDATITEIDLDILNNAGSEEEQDDINEDNAQVDSSDEDGDELNERSDLSGGDLDVPGAELDDADELLGEEDEENNSYSDSNAKEDN